MTEPLVDDERWAATLFPDAEGWERLGPWRWRARLVTPRSDWIYVLGGEPGVFASSWVTNEFLECVPGVEAYIASELERRVDVERVRHSDTAVSVTYEVHGDG